MQLEEFKILKNKSILVTGAADFEIMAMEDFYYTYVLLSGKEVEKCTSYTSDLPLRLEAH